MDTADKYMLILLALAILCALVLIGGCTYATHNEALGQLALEQHKLDLQAAGKPTETTLFVHKLDDDQFQQLVEAIKENKP